MSTSLATVARLTRGRQASVTVMAVRQARRSDDRADDAIGALPYGVVTAVNVEIDG